MQVCKSIIEYKELRKLNQFFTKIGLVVMGKVFHQGVGQVLAKMIENSDCRIVFVNVEIVSFKEKEDLINSLKPFNIDYLVFRSSDDFDFDDFGLFEIRLKNWPIRQEKLFFYMKILNLFDVRYLYIGQKDFLEAKLVLEMISVFNFNCQLQVVPNFRNEERVLVSSKLFELSENGLEDVKVLCRSLEFLQRMIHNGTKSVNDLEDLLKEFLLAFPNFQLTELLFLNAVNLSTIKEVDVKNQNFIQIKGDIEGFSFVDNLIC